MLREIEESKKFSDCTAFFGAKMHDTHSIEETPEGRHLSKTLVVTGPLKWLWIKLVAQNVADTIPDKMEAPCESCKKCLIYLLALINQRIVLVCYYGNSPLVRKT